VRLSSVDPGFDPQNVLRLDLSLARAAISKTPSNRIQFYVTFLGASSPCPASKL